MKTKLALCALAVCLVPTITSGQQVSVNYNHNQSFTQYHTYAWASNNANQIQNSILAQVAQQDIDAAMQGKGLQKVPESQNPDLILLDMSLPVLDGWEAARRLKADAATAKIPVIALTAHAMVQDKEKALAAGCDDFDTKPVELPRLLEKINSLLQNGG